MNKTHSNTILLAIIACLLWSSAFVGVKIGLQYHTPLQFAGIRFFISGIMLIFLAKNIRNFLNEIKTNFPFVLLIALLQIVIQYSLFYIGIDLVPGSVAAMVVGSSPLFISVVAHFSVPNDRIDRMKLTSILLGIAGVAMISLRKQLPSGAEIALPGIFILILNNSNQGLNS